MRAFGFFAASGEGRAQRVSADGVFEAQTLLRNESAGWITLRSLAREGGLHAGPGIQRHDRPVAAEGERSALCLNAAPDPGTRGTLGSDIAGPYAERVVVGIGMQRLHAGNDAEFAEAVDIGGGDGLDVLDARAAILRMIHRGGVLVGVERQAHGLVSDGMRENLKAACVEIG